MDRELEWGDTSTSDSKTVKIMDWKINHIINPSKCKLRKEMQCLRRPEFHRRNAVLKRWKNHY